MDDDVVGGVWQLDPDTRLALRLKTVREASDAMDWPRTVLEAEELLDDAPKHAETLALLGNAMLELGDAENAIDAFEDHLAVHPPTSGILSGLAIARFEMCDLDGAVLEARLALQLDGSIAEAHYTLALALERKEEGAQAAAEFYAAHILDPPAYPLPLELTDEQLELALRKALPSLPPPLLDFWRYVPIRFEQEPSLQELRLSDHSVPPTVAGLYDGTPPHGDEVLTARPTALRLFRKNLARSGSLEEVTRQLALVLEQEAIDWLGAPLEALEDQ